MKLENLQGQTLSGRFRLDSLLGQGGYGAVFEAEQLSVGRRCAVKVLFPKLCDDEATVQRFRTEARATSRLTHPNSVILYDFGRDDEHGLLFLAMELIDGRDLASVIQRRGTFGVEETVHIIRQAAASLYEAHQMGLVHRDIKPRNIMLLERGNDPRFVKVIDFGIAKVVQGSFMTVSDLTHTGTVIGTPKYMSPEQIRDGDIDGRTDLYALAMSVYKMLTGRAPFEDGTALEIAARQVAEAPEPIGDMMPALSVSEDFEAVLLRALKKEPSERFSTVIEFAEALTEAAGRAAVMACHSGTTPAAMPMRSAQMSTGLEMPAPSLAASTEEALPEAAVGKLSREAHAVSDDLGVSDVEGGGDVEASGDVEAGKTLVTLAIPNPARPDAGGGTDRAGTTAEVAELNERETPAPSDDDTAADARSPMPDWLAPWHAAAAVVLIGALAAGMWLATSSDDAAGHVGDASTAEAQAADEVDETQAVAVDQPEAGETLTATVDATGSAGGARDDDVADDSDQETPPKKADSAPAGKRAAGDDRDAPDTAEPKEQHQSAQGQASDQDESAPEKAAPARRVRRSVQVRVIPWGTLYVNGREVGDGTRHTLRLREGRHRLELRQSGEVRASQTVDVSSGSSKIVELVAR